MLIQMDKNIDEIEQHVHARDSNCIKYRNLLSIDKHSRCVNEIILFFFIEIPWGCSYNDGKIPQLTSIPR